MKVPQNRMTLELQNIYVQIPVTGCSGIKNPNLSFTCRPQCYWPPHESIHCLVVHTHHCWGWEQSKTIAVRLQDARKVGEPHRDT